MLDSTFEQWVSTGVIVFLPPKGTFGVIWRHFSCHNWGRYYWHLVGGGMLLKVLQCTGQYSLHYPLPQLRILYSPKCQ